MNIKDYGFGTRSPEELSEINSGKNENKSKGAKRRWLKERSPETVAIMDLFKSNDPTEAFEFFTEEVLEQKRLTEEVQNVSEKIKLRDLFLKRIYDLLSLRYGTKQFIDMNADIDLQAGDFAERVCKKLFSNKENENQKK